MGGKPLANDVDLLRGGRENRTVSFFRVVAVVCALVAPVADASHGLIGFALSSRAEACCAAMRGECAGLSTPDTCCQTRQVSAAPDLTTTAPVPAHSDLTLPVSAVGIGLATDCETSRDWLVREAFKRPHDPPHLHGFPLLI